MIRIQDRIADALEIRKMTAKDLADKTGISKSSISQYMNGIVKPKADRIYLIAKALNVNEAWLLGYNVPMDIDSEPNAIPLYSQVSCGVGMFIDDLIEDYITIPARLLNPNKEYFAVTANGDSMVGKGILDGDVLVFEKTQHLENGQIGCFCIDNNCAVCKIFRSVNGVILLESANEKYDPIFVDVMSDCFRIIGKYICRFTV